MYQTGRSERCIYNVPISGALDSRLQVKQVSNYKGLQVRKMFFELNQLCTIIVAVL